MSVIVIIMAAGRGLRMSDVPKQYLKLGEKSILRRSIEAFIRHPLINNVITVIHEADIELYKEATLGLDLLDPVIGSSTRQGSAKLGLEALINIAPKKVLIHDAARPFVDSKIISSVINELDFSRAVVPCIPIEDTIKKCEGNKVLWTVDRSDLWRAQTPQGFLYQEILHNHQKYKDLNFTDDCSINEHANISITVVPGSSNNFKITTEIDYERAENFLLNISADIVSSIKVGIGYDIHKFLNIPSPTGGIPLGCVSIPYNFAIEAHSDGDVLSHAVTDAILGAIGEGDIGDHFPPSDQKWKNASSIIFLRKAIAMMKSKGGKIQNMDIVITTERPKISPYKDAIRQSLAGILEIDTNQINIKAKTKEGLDSVGKGYAIEAHVICLIKLLTEKN